MKKSMLLLLLASSLFAKNGEEVFKTYCWGCHHQSAVAFGPPFEEIASKRTGEEIKAMITDPEAVSKVLGYKRNAMPKIELKQKELQAITSYILSFKKPDENGTH